MRSITEINDKYFYDNGYWKHGDEVLLATEKWRKLLDTCIRNTKRGCIVTPEILIKTINGETKRTPYVKQNTYIRKKNRINDN